MYSHRLRCFTTLSTDEFLQKTARVLLTAPIAAPTHDTGSELFNGRLATLLPLLGASKGAEVALEQEDSLRWLLRGKALVVIGLRHLH